MKMNRSEAEKVLNHLDFEKDLVTAVTRDYRNKEILMVAFMNEEAARETLTKGNMYYWSREREELWKKGEESGNVQKVRDIHIDCDGDTLLFDVDPEGPACHKGYRSCFYRKITENGETQTIMEKKFDPDKVYD